MADVHRSTGKMSYRHRHEDLSALDRRNELKLWRLLAALLAAILGNYSYPVLLKICS